MCSAALARYNLGHDAWPPSVGLSRTELHQWSTEMGRTSRKQNNRFRGNYVPPSHILVGIGLNEPVSQFDDMWLVVQV